VTNLDRRVVSLEDHYRRVGPHGHPDAVWESLQWAMSPEDRATWRALVARYEGRLGTHPESLSPDDLDPADFATLLRIMARSYARLGWPIRPDAAHVAEPSRAPGRTVPLSCLAFEGRVTNSCLRHGPVGRVGYPPMYRD